ncbi:hypothetical protein A3Q56_08499 [Intoshia linei]|uniref:MULE transposase domain-containing protein n=1 Tax=Intoshia linei TaxID=1819745 RepID=A0A177AP31_9BILA|nr:hypothetical protein A3Q56_08499 [Intoshia linei]
MWIYDYDRKFHLISIFVSSDETETTFAHVFGILKININFTPAYIVADGSDAIRTAAKKIN